MNALSILYVDDDPDIREIGALSLALDGAMTVQTAESGLAALDLIKGGLRPDLILLDVMMPDMDGPGALLAIREQAGLSDTPVIFITARALHNEQAMFLSLGAKGVIVKPFDPITLASQVRELLGRA